MKFLVIGYGNTLRGDDGLGPRVADQVARLNLPEVRTLAVHQLTPELAAEISQAEQVIFIDALIAKDNSTQPPSTQEASVREGRVESLSPQSSAPTLDHRWTPSLLLQLAKTLYGAEPLASHLFIPAIKFDYGETLSPIALSGIDWAVQAIQVSVELESAGHA